MLLLAPDTNWKIGHKVISVDSNNHSSAFVRSLVIDRDRLVVNVESLQFVKGMRATFEECYV